jgi:N6-L-threonylcarbamoyladenine synthase
MPLILGIETSCDETAAAVVEEGRVVRSNVVASQHDTHALYGGVVPELAARAHVDRIDGVMSDALASAGISARDTDAVAVTAGPGLAGALLVGVAAAKGIALAARRPLVGVNHLAAHVRANVIEHADFEPPAIVLVVSGGHTLLVRVSAGALAGDFTYDVLGQTVDDAAGEAFDKVARFLGLGYPGGPAIDLIAAQGDPAAVRLPRAMLRDGLDFSFSGLKTAVVQAVRRAEDDGDPLPVEDVAAAFQAAAVDVLVQKTMRAASEAGVGAVALAGGVAANSLLRERVLSACEQRGLRCFLPSPALCADNAAMVAAAADPRVRAGDFDGLDLAVRPDWRL